ncbi:GntR family transcriptional regulator [Streptomyces sp. NPDC007861]|uniref:GntR family transcriptional regulator n=1 Tax=Streptomyces sp. NPDC007861 TaxID=3154893 RepID=UPI0033D572EA
MKRNSALPLYRQVEDTLRTRIESGALRPGDRLPSETELAQSLGVNRLTVRQALAGLNRAGLVQARQGVGTFVTAPPLHFSVEVDPSRFETVAERTQQAMIDAGYPTPLREIPVPAAPDGSSDEARAELGLGDEPLAAVDTLSTMADQPWVVSTYTFSAARFPELRQVVENGTPPFLALREHYGVDLRYSWRSFAAAPASPHDAELLDVPVGSPVLLREGVSVDADGTSVVHVSRRCRSDRVRFVLRYAQEDGGA